MLWKTIIKRAEQFVLNNPVHVNARKITAFAAARNLKAWEYLRTIDVRHADELREVLPEAFPKKLQRLPLVVDQNIHGKWRVKCTDKETVN